MSWKRSLALLVLAGSTLALASCGNYLDVEWSGRTGVSHDGRGNLTFHVITCENSTKRVEIVAGREGLADDETNPVIGSYVLDEPVAGPVVVREEGPSPWSVEQELALPEDPSRFFIVTARPEDTGGPRFLAPEKYIADAAVTYEQLVAAPAGAVVTGIEDGPSFLTREEFDATCEGR